MERTIRETQPIDYRTVDWPRVERAVYHVRHHYRYTYTGPVTDLKQRLMMIPPDTHGGQRLLDHRFEVRGVDGRPTLTRERDDFDNRVIRVLAERVDRAVDFEASYRVERSLDRSSPSAVGRVPLDRYLRPTALTAPDGRLRVVARELARGVDCPRELAELAHDWAAGAISYQLGVTGVQTPAAMALHLQKGVCQDYAHIMLCVLRLLDIPARYVSGHLLGEGAPHAWVEALLEDPTTPGGVTVVAYDPTHHRRAGLNYVTVAVGRDYADIAMTSGFFSGPAAGRLSSSKQAEIVEIDYRDSEAREDAA